MTHAERRSISGRVARAAGESLESRLDAYHSQIAARSVAFVRRVGTPVKVLGKTSKDARGRTYFRAAFDGYQGADFSGFDSNGRHICLEAKSHAGTGAWDCGIDPSGEVGASGAIDGPQWRELRQAEHSGAVSLIILQAWGEAWAISPHSIDAHARFSGRRTVRPAEVSTIGRRLAGVQWWVNHG